MLNFTPPTNYGETFRFFVKNMETMLKRYTPKLRLNVFECTNIRDHLFPVRGGLAVVKIDWEVKSNLLKEAGFIGFEKNALCSKVSSKISSELFRIASIEYCFPLMSGKIEYLEQVVGKKTVYQGAHIEYNILCDEKRYSFLEIAVNWEGATALFCMTVGSVHRNVESYVEKRISPYTKLLKIKDQHYISPFVK